MAKLIPEKFKLKDGREVTFKSPDAEDWSKIRDYVECIKVESENTYQYPGQPPLPEESTRKKIQNHADSKKSMMVSVELEGRFIAQMDFWPVHANENHPWISHNTYFGMGVIKEFWGQGVAKRLLEVLEREAKKLGYTWIRAEVRNSNERGIKLYTNFGFKITGAKEKYTFINGKYYDDLFISKEIL